MWGLFESTLQTQKITQIEAFRTQIIILGNQTPINILYDGSADEKCKNIECLG